ncbi:hypothetical protein ACFPOE_22240 [Caenimonas terrae]|uniref:VCBS repeat-containing protein n=1 Tax=Caenimonas terrae TaxID=696074 RepID=A0ABW0NIQ7_9BURK
MANRIDRFHAARNATRNLLEWLAVAALSILAALALVCKGHAGEPDASHLGQLLRPAVDAVDLAGLPAGGWYRVTSKEGALQVQAVEAPVSRPGEEEAEAIDTRYIRVPGARIAEGRLPALDFGGGLFAPRPDHAYQLELNGRRFTLSVGQGPVYTVGLGEDSYGFRLPAGPASDSEVLAVADLDSDGKPDFIVRVDGQEVLLLSSLTQPGLNPPAAVLALRADGC